MKALLAIWICFICAIGSAQINLRGWLGPINPDGLTTNSGSYGQVISKTGGNMKWIDNGVGGGISSDTATNIAAYQAYLATNGLSPGGGSQTPITQDVDYATYTATNLLAIHITDGISDGERITFDTGRLSFSGGADFGANLVACGSVTVNSGTVLLNSNGSASLAGGLITLNADGGASFANGQCTIDGSTGKVTDGGIIDPPAFLFDRISQADLLQLCADQIASNKLTGLLVGYNGTNLMAYEGSSKRMFSIPMQFVTNVSLPAPRPKTIKHPRK